MNPAEREPVVQFLQDKKVLVTGGSGFIGMHIVRELLRNNVRVRVPLHERPLSVGDDRIETVQADLLNREDCLRALEGIDCLVHAAGTVGAAGVSDHQQMDGITLNMILTAQVLQASWAQGVGRVLLFGSSTGYPAYDHAVSEEEMWRDEPHPSYFGYGWMRRYIEKLGEYVARKSSCGVVMVRPSAVYGAWDNFSDSGSHVIPALIKRAAKKENPFVVWGTGNEVRDFIHATDFARACVLALEKCSGFEALNVGAGRACTIRDIVEIILAATGHRDARVIFDHTKPVTIPFRLLNIDKARTLLGFEPEVSLEQGLNDTVRWYLDNLAVTEGKTLHA